jgi:ABC-type branched-subunit amino acid transport system permease subunit
VSAYLPFLVIGVTLGSIYGIAAMGLVLSYKTSGIFNFGHGALAALAAVLFFELRQRQGLSWPIAALVAVLVFGVVAGLIMEAIARGLAGVPTSYKVVATVGLLVFIRAAVTIKYGPSSLPFHTFLPQGVAFTISGVRVTYENVIVVAFGAAAAVALYLFFQRTRLGTAMRGVVDDPQLLDMAGTSPIRVRRTAWLIGCTFAAVSGVLLASAQQQIDPTLLALLVIAAFGAAAVGGFTSLPISYAGGIGVGVVQAIVSKEAGTYSVLRGIDLNIPFIVLFIALLVLPKRRLVELGQRVKPRAVAPLLPTRWRLGVFGLVGVAALFLPQVVGVHLVTWNTAMAEIVLYLSLGLLVRTSGQISLCQIGFAAIGAATFAHLLANSVPWPVAVLLAGLVAVPVGALISIPAIRLAGLYLGLATLGFGVLLAQYFYGKGYLFGTTQGLATSRPVGFTSDKSYYYVLLAFVVASILVVVVVERSRLGRLLRCLADSPVGLSTLGTSINVTRVLVFCLSAFLAGVSGALTASIFAKINQDSFSYVQSIVILAILMIAGRTTISAAIVAPLISTIPPAYISNPNIASWLQVFFGLAAIAVALLSQGRFGDLVAGALARRQPAGAPPNRLGRRASFATVARPPIPRASIQEIPL